MVAHNNVVSAVTFLTCFREVHVLGFLIVFFSPANLNIGASVTNYVNSLTY
jgi:hypothetical protein